MNEVQILYCHDKNNEVVFYKKAIKGEQYYCIDCKSELIVKEGQVYQKHLAHKDAENCGGTGVSAIEKEVEDDYVSDYVEASEYYSDNGETTNEDEIEDNYIEESRVSEVTEEHLQRIKECDPDIIRGMNFNQKLATTHMNGACVVSAGGGAGKSTVLLGRIQYLISQGVDPNRILAFTFTKKASEEMKERLNKLIGIQSCQVTIGTFHSVYYSILRDHQRRGIGRKPLSVAPDWWREKVTTDIIRNLSSNIEPKMALSFISKQKNNLISPNGNLIMQEDMEFLLPEFREIYRQYEDIKNKEGKIDFEDMVFKCYDIFQKDKEFLEYYRNKFQYILVDEFQDSNTMQEKMLELIVNGDKNLFVVGDVRQSIYGFLDANVNLMLDFQTKWDSRLIELDINYRCSSEIVEYSNKLISHSRRTLGGEVKANKSSNGKPIFFESFDEYEESYNVVKEIQTILKQDEYTEEDITILYRIGAQSQPLEEAMIKANLPYVVIGGIGFYDRREIKDMVSYLHLARNPHNDKAMKEVFNRPNRYLGKEFLQLVTSYAKANKLSIFDSMVKAPFCKEWRYKKGTTELIGVVKQLNQIYKNGSSAKEIIYSTIEMTKYRNFLAKTDEEIQINDRFENIATLIRFGEEDDFNTVDKLLDHVDTIKPKNNEEDTKGKIKLMTTHRSKGLEFKNVFIVGVSHGQFPFYREQYKHDFDLEEERRLMYVAMTRAEDKLYISSIKNYRGKSLPKSQFLKEMRKRG